MISEYAKYGSEEHPPFNPGHTYTRRNASFTLKLTETEGEYAGLSEIEAFEKPYSAPWDSFLKRSAMN